MLLQETIETAKRGKLLSFYCSRYFLTPPFKRFAVGAEENVNPVWASYGRAPVLDNAFAVSRNIHKSTEWIVGCVGSDGAGLG